MYQSLLHLSWVDNLLTTAKALFTRRYAADLKPQPQHQQHVASIDTRDFDQTFDALLRKLDTGSTRRAPSEVDSESQAELTPPSSTASQADDQDGAPAPPVPLFKKPALAPPRDVAGDTTSPDDTPVATPDASRPGTPLHASSHLLAPKAGPGGLSRKQRKKANQFGTSALPSSGDESDRRPKSSQGKTKAKRIWDASGVAQDYNDEVLDYSAAAPPSTEQDALDVEDVNATRMGNRTVKGQFVLKDLDDEVEAILAESKRNADSTSTDKDVSGLIGTATSKLSGLFRNVVGGRALTKQDLEQPMQAMRNSLIEKNVAPEAAGRLCSSVETDLLNSKTASFTSIDKTIRESMGRALTKILTPTSSLDLLRNINNTIEGQNPRPYVISIVGVNGVGKSTNLSKIAYFLLQNKFRVLVVACDTFRSGAVEQLRVHVRNLTELSRREANVGTVELFEKGYGKDAADVAKQAVAFASNAGGGGMLYDVVLIDTAGRRHNDQRLMSSLTKFGQLANPDKIFMVGEALVGTDSVSQARHFAEQFVDRKGQMRSNGKGMDGFIISKCDTVGDMVGTLVSMVHATGKSLSPSSLLQV